MNARQLFIDAFNTRMTKEAEAKAEYISRETEKTIIAFKRLTDMDLEKTDVVDGNVVIIGDDLALKCASANVWKVRGLCPKCGHNCWSYDCYSEDDIGSMLVGFHPSYDHCCPPESTGQVSWQEKLAAALAEAIEEMQI
jgi:hypothetical protein